MRREANEQSEIMKPTANSNTEPAAFEESKREAKRILERMTKETPWKAILLFSIPVFLGNLIQQFYSMADTMIVGRYLGVLPLAGVGSTSSMNFLVIGFATGLTGGFSVVTAQRAGQGDWEKVRLSVASSIGLSAIISFAITALSVALTEPILHAMHTPDDIFVYARDYIRLIYLGLSATVFYNLGAGMLRAIGDSRTPLYFLIFSSILNIILDLVAILWMHLGVAGAAGATVVSQLISAALCYVYSFSVYPQLKPSGRHFHKLGVEAWEHLRIGLPMALQFSVTAIGIMILQSYLNAFGALVIAGYTAASKVESLVTQPFIALSMTMEVYCGQNFGAGDFSRVRRGIRASIGIGMLCVALASFLNVVFGRQMVSLFLNAYDREVVEYGYSYLIVIAIFFFLLCSLQIMRSSLQGMGEATVPMTGGVLELIARWGGCALMAAPFGYVGVYLSTPLAWGLALSILLVRYAMLVRAHRAEKA